MDERPLWVALALFGSGLSVGAVLVYTLAFEPYVIRHQQQEKAASAVCRQREQRLLKDIAIARASTDTVRGRLDQKDDLIASLSKHIDLLRDRCDAYRAYRPIHDVQNSRARGALESGAIAYPEGLVFESGSPFPIGYGKIKPGVPISMVQQISPGGRKTATGYMIDFTDGPITTVGCMYGRNSSEADPVVDAVVFWAKQEISADMRSKAATAFGLNGAKVSAGGRKIVWKNLHGYDVTIRDNEMYVQISD